MLENNVNITPAIDAERGIISRSEIGLYVAQDEKIIGLIGVSDPPRENIKRHIRGNCLSRTDYVDRGELCPYESQ